MLGWRVVFGERPNLEPVLWEMVGDMGDIAILKFRGQSLMMPSLRRLAGELPTFLVLVISTSDGHKLLYPHVASGHRAVLWKNDAEFSRDSIFLHFVFSFLCRFGS